jgi:glycosyltransferase involved in cell wall biosynthesis
MEGMACGKAIIASRMGGLTDIVAHEETGLLVPPGAADALAAAMERLSNNPALRARMGAAGKHKVIEFTASTAVQRLEQAYQSLLRR